MKKTLSMILALLMSASCASYIFADEAEVEATAAIEDDAVVEEVVEEVETEYDDAIEFLTLKNIMHGMEDGLNHAELGVERYQMALFAGRVSTGWVEDSKWEDGAANDSEFTDLEGTAAENVYGAISYVNQKGIIEGYGDGTFKPEKGVTYREALTMAVRTLEYQGLDYPWGYIEKAIGLGLTDGITGVAYTDEINRGVAAQIVYNMLFADTKSGDTLAMRSFGVEYGWQNIIITATNAGTYEAKADTTKNVGVVGFKVINEDGTLGDETYYLNEDLALGSMYNALFEIDADNEYVDIVGAHEYVATAIENKGLTDDEAVEYEDADKIGTFLKDFTLVNKYGSSILANSNLYRNELIVADAGKQYIVIEYKDAKDTIYAVDWTTGDILKKVYEDDDNRNSDDDKDDYVWEVEWFYNRTYNYFFQYQSANVENDKANRDDNYDVTTDTIELIGYDIMDDKDLAELQKAVKKALEKEVGYDAYTKLTEKPATTAYALLLTYDLNGDEVADYATYEAYKLAKFQSDDDIKVMCEKCDSDKKGAYQFTGLDLTNLDQNGDVKYMPEGACDHYSIKDGKIGELYANAEPTKGAYRFADDSLVPANDDYVIYGVNEATNEIKVVKIIAEYGENTDADSFVTTGVVRGYNINNNTVTIGNDNLEYNYTTLAGNAFVKVSDKKTDYANALMDLLNQFVEYVVVDGKLVYVKVLGQDENKDNYIVVESYCGIDSDNYIVVNGYHTADLEYGQYRIGSYDSWLRGDFFFYEEQIDDEFNKGAVYKIKSADMNAENGPVYYVENLGDRINSDECANTVELTFKDGYRYVTVTDDTKSSDNTTYGTKRMSDDDKYIIIDVRNPRYSRYAPIYVHEGKVEVETTFDTTGAIDGGWYVKGKMLTGGTDKSTFIISLESTTNSDVNGFNEDTYKTGFVAILEKSRITEVNYNGYGQDYYIYGQTNYMVEVFDILTGKDYEAKAGSNIKLEKGKIYTTIDGNIIETEDDGRDDKDWDAFKRAFENNAYADDNIVSQNYETWSNIEMKKAYIDGKKKDAENGWMKDKDIEDKQLFSYEVIGEKLLETDNQYTDLVDSYKVYLVEKDDDHNIKAMTELTTKVWDKNFTAADGQTITPYAWVVYNVETRCTVVYVEACQTVTKETKVDQVATVTNRLVDDSVPGKKAYIDAEVTYDATYVNGELESYTIKSVSFGYNKALGDLAVNTDGAIAKNGWVMGIDADDLYYGELRHRVPDGNIVREQIGNNGSITPYDSEDDTLKTKTQKITVDVNEENIELLRLVINKVENNDPENATKYWSFQIDIEENAADGTLNVAFTNVGKNYCGDDVYNPKDIAD